MKLLIPFLVLLFSFKAFSMSEEDCKDSAPDGGEAYSECMWIVGLEKKFGWGEYGDEYLDEVDSLYEQGEEENTRKEEPDEVERAMLREITERADDCRKTPPSIVYMNQCMTEKELGSEGASFQELIDSARNHYDKTFGYSGPYFRAYLYADTLNVLSKEPLSKEGQNEDSDVPTNALTCYGLSLVECAKAGGRYFNPVNSDSKVNRSSGKSSGI